MRSIASEVREHMASLGFEKMEDMIGRVDVIKPKDDISGYASQFDFAPILHKPVLPKRISGKQIEVQEHKINAVLDRDIIKTIASRPNGKKFKIEVDIKNTDRSITKLHQKISYFFWKLFSPA